MSKRITQSYTPEFRAEAIKLVLEQGFSVAEAAARLNMNQGTLAYWVTQARKAGKNAPQAKTGAQRAGGSPDGARYPKKAMAYFARESLPGTRS